MDGGGEKEDEREEEEDKPYSPWRRLYKGVDTNLMNKGGEWVHCGNNDEVVDMYIPLVSSSEEVTIKRNIRDTMEYLALAKCRGRDELYTLAREVEGSELSLFIDKEDSPIILTGSKSIAGLMRCPQFMVLDHAVDSRLVIIHCVNLNSRGVPDGSWKFLVYRLNVDNEKKYTSECLAYIGSQINDVAASNGFTYYIRDCVIRCFDATVAEGHVHIAVYAHALNAKNVLHVPDAVRWIRIPVIKIHNNVEDWGLSPRTIQVPRADNAAMCHHTTPHHMLLQFQGGSYSDEAEGDKPTLRLVYGGGLVEAAWM